MWIVCSKLSGIAFYTLPVLDRWSYILWNQYDTLHNEVIKSYPLWTSNGLVITSGETSADETDLIDYDYTYISCTGMGLTHSILARIDMVKLIWYGVLFTLFSPFD